MKKLLSLVLVCVLILSLTACAGGTAKPSASPADSAALPKDFTIAYAAVTTNLAPWVKAIADTMQQMCDTNGWKLITYDGKGDVNTQTDQIASIISDKEANLVVLFPVNSDTGVTYVKDLDAAGIPVITLGSDVSPDGQSLVKCYVGPDQKAMVKFGADYIIKLFGATTEKNYVILSGFQGQYDYVVREQAVKDNFANTKFKLLDVTYCGAARDKAMEQMTTYLNTYDNIDFVFCLSDEFALGAIQAIDAAGKTGKINIVSMEAFKDSIQAIKDGKLDLTVSMKGADVVAKLIEIVPQVMAGQKVDYYQASGTNAISKDNIADWTADDLEY
ncbi:MAG: sugar ABC transporter substrate-binding protein [Clostridiales bacterium]|nr:sugar ABC transporter substrate-binding protein [Clostridiales bacterium]